MAAIVKYITRPVTSTSVATNGADEVAGSTLSRFKTIGIIEPLNVPHNTIPIKRKENSNGDKIPVMATMLGVIICPMKFLPDRNSDQADGSKNDSKCEPGKDLATHHIPPASWSKFIQCHGTNDKVAACEPLLPPLDIISGTNNDSTNAASSSD